MLPNKTPIQNLARVSTQPSQPNLIQNLVAPKKTKINLNTKCVNDPEGLKVMDELVTLVGNTNTAASLLSVNSNNFSS